MLSYDSKQIEANLKLAGFEDIKISDTNIKDEKTGHYVQTQSIEATKPESKRNIDISIQVKKTAYKENKPYKKEKYEEQQINEADLIGLGDEGANETIGNDNDQENNSQENKKKVWVQNILMI